MHKPIASLLAVAIAGTLPSQQRQFDLDYHRQPQVFLPAQAESFAIGDVDGDGDLDVLLTRVDPWLSRTELLLYRRQGSLWQPTSLGIAQGANQVLPRVGVTLSDLDADGDPDAALLISFEVGSPSARFSVFRNDGNGGFTVTGSQPLPSIHDARLAASDVDADGDLDVVVAGRNSAGQPQPAVLLRHDGAFGFQPIANALPTTPVVGPELADLDGDGDPDLLVADAAGVVLLWLNQSGVFGGAAIGAVGAIQMVAGDVDGDSDLDVVTQRADGGADLLRNAAVGFVAQTLTASGLRAGQQLALVDLDGDLDRDVALVVDGSLRVLRNDGSGNFTNEIVAAAKAFAAVDADQDGITDLLFQLGSSGMCLASGRPGSMSVDPAALRYQHAPGAARGFTEEVADLDGDGRVDLVQQDAYEVSVRVNRGVGEWTTVMVSVPFLRPGIRSLDADGDGDRDLAVGNEDAAGGLLLLRNDGNFSFTPLTQPSFGYVAIAGVGDFDGDQRDDLLINTGTAPTLKLLRSLGGGAFAPPVAIAGGVDWSIPGITDLDGDQDLDLVAEAGFSCVGTWINDGSGNLAIGNPCAGLVPGGWLGLVGIRLVDIDGDGDSDLFTGGYGSGQMFVNNGGTFTAGQPIQGVFGSSLLKPWFADWDGDGDQDLMQLGGPPQVWLNSGNGTLVDSGNTRAGWTQFSAAGAADLDGDGDVDPIGVFGMSGQHRWNHQRGARSLVAPTPGGQMQVRYAHAPGYSTGNSLCIPILSLGRRSAPLAVPGIAGTLQIDMTTAVLLPVLAFPAPVGTADSTFAIPVQPGLIGFPLYAQGLILGGEIAFTPAVHERVQ